MAAIGVFSFSPLRYWHPEEYVRRWSWQRAVAGVARGYTMMSVVILKLTSKQIIIFFRQRLIINN